MRILKRKCIGGPLDGQEITVADFVDCYNTAFHKSDNDNYELKEDGNFHHVDNKKPG